MKILLTVWQVLTLPAYLVLMWVVLGALAIGLGQMFGELYRDAPVLLFAVLVVLSVEAVRFGASRLVHRMDRSE